MKSDGFEKYMEPLAMRMTISMTDVQRREMKRDRISTFWMRIENAE